MNCHGNNKEHESHNHSPLKHMVHMVICCGLPILIVAAIPVIAKFSPAAGKLFGGIAPFLCPIMMLAMMPMMLGGGKKKNCCDKNNNQEDDI